MCAAGWPVSPVWARFGGGVCYKVVPAGGVAPDPSTPSAARGSPKYHLRGGYTGCRSRVRLRQVVGGGLLKRTCPTFFTGRCGRPPCPWRLRCLAIAEPVVVGGAIPFGGQPSALPLPPPAGTPNVPGARLPAHPAGPGPERAPSATCCLLPPRTAFLSPLPCRFLVR